MFQLFFLGVHFGTLSASHFGTLSASHELKVRQIDHNIIFGWWYIPIMAISSVYFTPAIVFVIR